PGERDDRLPRIVVFSDDWGRHASSCQHLITSLLPRYRVDWVETIGTRTPRLSWADAKRSLQKIASMLGPKDADGGRPALHANLRIHNPRMLPSFASPRRRRWNARLLERGLASILSPSDPPDAIITTAPIVADLAARTPHLHWVYYCVDALDEWPGLDGKTLCQMELDMLPHMDRVLVVSEVLEKRMASRGITATMLTHGVDLERWKPPGPAHPAADPPETLFWGHADERLHEGICLALAERTQLCFVGPRGNVASNLAGHPRIRWEGTIPFDQLPVRAGRADVLVMPYGDSEATRNMQPLKLKEYLATGMPTVATSLPANLHWSAAMDLADDPDSFVERVLARAGQPLPAAQVEARLALAQESWTAKAAILEEAIHAR
ncbi:MAG: glycosyltransferase, partial [Planctomycetes bacterium]|nr:glycosyltransferase [Planctomycetota bacterium]